MYRDETEGLIDSHREEVIEDICTSCRINSEKIPYAEGKPYREGPFQALQTTLGMAEGYSFSIRNYDDYMGTAGFSDRERQPDILAHLDVVLASEGWMEARPLEPVVKDGKFFRRDTADNKGPVVTTLYAVRVMKELGVPLNKNVRLILDTDEERRSSDIVNYYDKKDEAPVTFSPDAELPITNIERGHLEGHFRTSFQTSEAMSRLTKVEIGIKANVVPGKARAVVEDIDPRTLETTAETVERETGISFVLEGDLPVITVTVQGEDAHASMPQGGRNAPTGLLVYLTRLPFAECPQMDMVKNLLKLFPYGDTCGKVIGISMKDELSGALALALSMLTVGADGLEDVFDSRCPICVTEESVLEVVKQVMTNQELILENDSMMPPHHMDGNSHSVRTPLSIYKDYTGLEGSCQATGGGTCVHSLKNGVAYGAALLGTGNRMYGADGFVVVGELVLDAKTFVQITVELCS